MGDAIIDMSKGSGIESMDRGEPRLQTSPDGSFPWVGMFVEAEFEHGTELDFTGFEPTLDQIAQVHSQDESGRTLQELADNTERMYRIMFQRGRQEDEHPWLVAHAKMHDPVFNVGYIKTLIQPGKVDRNDRADEVRNYG